MKLYLVLIGVCLQCIGLQSFIVPDEVPTILSLIYSNIPTIKKGTDSRLGWGFRLGDRADFQVLVELGPQKNTQPIGNQESGGNKRHVDHNAINVLYAQVLAEQQKRERLKLQQKQKISPTDGGKWIQQWSQSMNPADSVPKQTPTFVPVQEGSLTSLGIGEVDAKLVIPEDGVKDQVEPLPLTIGGRNKAKPMRIKVQNGGKAIQQQQQEISSESIPFAATYKPKTRVASTTLSPKDALDNVDLDD